MSQVPLGDAGGGPNSPDNNDVDLQSIIPEGFADKPYMQGIDSVPKLFEQFDNVQKLIGKKTVGVPDKESPQEEWDSFYNKMGRPEAAEKYEFSTEVELPEQLQRSDEQLGQLKQVFHEAGLTAQQANYILKKNDESLLENFNKQKDTYDSQINQEKEQWKDFMKEHFGENEDKAREITNNMLKDNVPEGMKETVEKLDDKSFQTLMLVLNNIHKNHIAEDSFDKKGGGDPRPAGEQVEALKAEGEKLMAQRRELGYSKEGEEMQKQINEIFQKKIPDLQKRLQK